VETTAADRKHAMRAVIMTAAIAGLGGLLFGYDTGVIASALLFIGPDFGLSRTSRRSSASGSNGRPRDSAQARPGEARAASA